MPPKSHPESLAIICLLDGEGYDPTSTTDLPNTPTIPQPAIQPGQGRFTAYGPQGAVVFSQRLKRDRSRLHPAYARQVLDRALRAVQSRTASIGVSPTLEDTLLGLDILHYLAGPETGQPDSAYVLQIWAGSDSLLTAVDARDGNGRATLWLHGMQSDSIYSETAYLTDSTQIKVKQTSTTLATLTIAHQTVASSRTAGIRQELSCLWLASASITAGLGMGAELRRWPFTDWQAVSVYADFLYEVHSQMLDENCYGQAKGFFAGLIDGFGGTVKSLFPRNRAEAVRGMRFQKDGEWEVPRHSGAAWAEYN